MSVPTQDESPAQLRTRSLVAISLLRAGHNTAGARVFKELSAQSPPTIDRLAEHLRIPPAVRGQRVRHALAHGHRAVTAARRLGLTILPVSAADYPDRLRQIPDPPIVLWIRGVIESLSAPAVAIVGSRAATPTGITVAARLARELAEAGLVIVSGMARGVDAAAHRGALDARGRTVAVLGSGADVIYPRQHAAMAQEIVERGAIVSELPPGTPPLPPNFPLRNRIISGLARAVVVIEASEKSGSLITAKAALEQGRDVLAVPGNVISGRHRGCHALIKDGARLVETVEDVLDELKWPRTSASVPATVNSLQLSELEERMAVGEPYSIDELSEATGRPAHDLLAELGTLEIAGRVTRQAGSIFVRT
jgi:DNA processing protein